MSAVPLHSARPGSPVDLTGEVPIIKLGGHEIPCVDEIAPGAFLDLVASTEREENFIHQAAAIQRFLYACVEEGQEPVLERLLFAKGKRRVDYDDLTKVVEILTEWYAARPTTRQSDSAGGASSISASSTENSPSPASPSAPADVPVAPVGAPKKVSLATGSVQSESSDSAATST